jgi:hypothetical protein
MKNLIFTIILCLCAGASFSQNDEQRANQSSSSNGAINPGYLLPEVTVSEEVQPGSLASDEIAARADNFASLDMRLFTVRIEKQIAKNEEAIVSIKERVQEERGKTAVKHWKQLSTLEIQNEELKKGLWDYLHYGKGDWISFKEDVEEDIGPLSEDLARLENEIH